jgi:AraC family transcriptional regulator
MEALGVKNVLLRARARRHQVRDFPGPLSIKSVVEGTVRWKTGSREIAVNENSFLVLNEGEPYSMDIDSPAPVETCCVFFERGFVDREIPSGLYPRDGRILPRMRTIAAAPRPDGMWMEEQFALLGRDLLLLREDVRRQIRCLPAVRASTREENFRRVSLAREFVHANLDRPLTLKQIAGEARLSPFHCHRVFVAAFGEPPHRYLRRIRLERAALLLRKQDRTVLEICGEVGFDSLGSFTTLFRRQFGVAPGAFRRKKQG